MHNTILGLIATICLIFAVCTTVKGRYILIRWLIAGFVAVLCLFWAIQFQLQCPLDLLWLGMNAGFLGEAGVLKTGLQFIGLRGCTVVIISIASVIFLTRGKRISHWQLPASFFGCWLLFGIFGDWDPAINLIPAIDTIRKTLHSRSDPWNGISPDTNRVTSTITNALKIKPHVIVVVIEESLTSRWINETNSFGQEITPTLNKLATSSDYWGNHLANAGYTIKAQEAILGGWIASGKEQAVERPNLAFTGLATQLQQNGYYPLFIQGTASSIYGKTLDTMRKIGFAEIISGGYFKSKTMQVSPDGWGIDDVSLFTGALNYIDKVQATNDYVFVCITTIENHYPFGTGSTESLRYQQSITRADSALNLFLQEVKKRKYMDDSLIVVTGDHAFLCGEFGGVYNLSFPYQEAFMVPLLILNNQINPQYHTQLSSHIDIAPTILDLIGGVASPNWQGYSLYHTNRPNQVVLTQPFGGNYIVLIQDREKLVIDQSRGIVIEYPLDTKGRDQLQHLTQPKLSMLQKAAAYK